MRDLTPRQRQILLLVQKTMHESGMPPTRAEIAKTLKFRSVNAAEEHLRALERKGVIELLPGMSRGIRLKDSMREQMGLPLVGRVAAGQPILAEEHIEARYQIDPELFKKPPHFLLACAWHEHARCRNSGWRLGCSASHSRGASSANRRRALGQRSHRQTVSTRRAPRLVDAGKSGVRSDSSGSARAIVGHRRRSRRRRSRLDEVIGCSANSATSWNGTIGSRAFGEARAPPSLVPSFRRGFAELDGHLPGGGWPLGAITEVFVDGYGIGELGFVDAGIGGIDESRSCQAPRSGSLGLLRRSSLMPLLCSNTASTSIVC